MCQNRKEELQHTSFQDIKGNSYCSSHFAFPTGPIPCSLTKKEWHSWTYYMYFIASLFLAWLLSQNTITKQKDNIPNEISFKWKCHATDKKQLYFLTIAKCLDYFLLGIIYVSWKTRKTNLTIVSFSRLWPDIYVFLNSLTCTSWCWR